MFYKHRLLIILFIFSGFFISCSDDPTSVGSSLIPDSDILKNNTYENFAESFLSFEKDSVYFGSSSTILLGNYNNIKSEALLAFFISLPDSIKEPLTNNEIVLKSSWFKIYPSYWIGDKSNIDFSVHKINNSWTPLFFNEDSLTNIKSSMSENLIETFNYKIEDTTISFSIDNELVETWARRSFDASYPSNYGILLSPESSANSIIGFQGVTSFPTNQFITLHMEFEKAGEFVDTVLSTANFDIHIPTGERLPDHAEGIQLQSSISVRGKIKFNIDQIPKNIIVNSAILDLYVIESDEGTIKTDTIAVSFLSNFNDEIVNQNFGRYPLKRDDEKFSGDIIQFIDRWLEGEENEGLEIKLSDESRSANAVSFYGNNATLKPKLTLHYTTK